MKTVSADFKTAQSQPAGTVLRRVSYKTRAWDSGTSSYVWASSWTAIPESQIVSVGTVTAKLDTDRLNEFKISNVDITVLNADGSWNPWGGSVFTGKEPYWTKFKIESGWVLASGATEYTPLFVGVVVGYTSQAGGDTVRFNIQGLEAILINANAEGVSTTATTETPSGTANGTNKDFTTLNPGVGIIDSVTLDSVAKKVGTDYDISQLNEPTLGAKITFKTAPTTGQAVRVSYKYWGQNQRIEYLVEDLLTVAGIPAENQNVSTVLLSGLASDLETYTSQADWSTGTYTDIDISRLVDSIMMDVNATSNITTLDAFTDGDYTNSPTWTPQQYHEADWTVSSNKLRNTSASYIQTPSNGAKTGTWEFKINVGNRSSNTKTTTVYFFVVSTSSSQGKDGIELYIPASVLGESAVVRLILNNSSVVTASIGSFSFNTDYTFTIKRWADGITKVYMNGTEIISRTTTVWNTSSLISFYVYGNNTDDGPIYFDDIKTPQATLTGTWVTPTIDMLSSTVIYGALEKEHTLNDGAISYYSSTSTDGSSWDSWELIDEYGNLNSVQRRYLKIKAVLSRSSSYHTEPSVQSLLFRYQTASTTILMANFTGKTCYEAIQSLGAFANYEFGFKEDETFFFRQKPADSNVDLALDYATNLMEFETVGAGHDRVYSEVQATFGAYDVIRGDDGTTSTGPLKRFGRKRFTVDGGDILLGPDTDVATGIATGMYDTLKDCRRVFRAKIKLCQWVDLSDTVSVRWGTEISGLLCKVTGVRHDVENMTSELDLEEII